MRRVVANAGYLLVEKGALLLASLALLVLVGRWAGMEALGQYTFAVSLASLAMPVLDLGLNSRVTKGVAGGDPRAARWRTDAFRIKLAVAPAAVAGPALFAWATNRPPDLVAATVLLGLSSVAISLGDLSNALFKGRERMGYSAGVTLLWNGLLTLGCVWSLKVGWGLIGLAAAYLASRLAYALLASALARRVWPASAPPARPSAWVPLIRAGVLSLPASYFLINMLNVSLILVTLFQGDRAGGHFALGQRLVAALFILSTAGIEAVFPAMARRFARNPADLSGPLARAAAATVLLGAGAAAAVGFVLEPGVRLLFGPHPEALPVIRLMVWATPSFALFALFHYALVASDRERAAFVSIGLLLTAGIVLNAWAASRWGATGGAVALVAWGAAGAVVMGLVFQYARQVSYRNHS